MLKLKTSQQTSKQPPKPEPSKIVKKDDPKPSIDLEDEQDETNLVDIKKPEKKQTPIQQTSNEGWQPSDEPKDLPTDGIGKKPNAPLKKLEEPIIEIRNEEFPDIAAAAEKQTKKQKNLQVEPKQEQKPQQNTNNTGLFMNSNSKQSNQTTTNVQTKNPTLNTNSGPLTFINTKKQENSALFQQQQQEQVKKTTQETQIQSQSQNQESLKSNPPPPRQVNFSRNPNVVPSQPVQEQQKSLKVEESIPLFTNSKAKGIPPVVQQTQSQQQQELQSQPEQQPQQNEDEDSDGWEVVEKKGKSKGSFQRNQKKN